MKLQHPFSGNRRTWILSAGAVTLTAIAARITYPIARRAGALWVTEYGDEQTPSDDALRVVAMFIGVLMGHHPLSPKHADMLISRLSFNRRRSRDLASKYAELAAYADRRARDANPGVSGFLHAPYEIRERVMTDVMVGRLNTPRAKLAALVSADGRARWRIRNSTAIHLRRLYRRSRVPWQLRGYGGALGAPANAEDYTRRPELSGA